MSRVVSRSLNLLHPKHSRRCGSLLLPFCSLGRPISNPLSKQPTTSFVPLSFVRWNSNSEGEIQEVNIKEEPKVEVPKEKIVGAHSTHEFQAQTRKILDIVARSLYTDREVFLRELVSNSSDALEKLRHLQLSGTPIADESLPLQITISVNEQARILTIQDTGIGMTEEELIKNLGTIARSGSEEFSKNLENPQESNIIGQFGVGFYSAFMIADRIEVFSRSANVDSKGYYWTSTGGGDFETCEAEGVTRGTKIVLHLKENSNEFTQIPRLENIIRKYSNFVGFDILIGGEKVNTVKALWMSNPSKVSDEDYNDFYQFVGHSYDQPLYRLHFNSDSPLPLNTLIFIPSKHQEKYGLSKQPSGISLYSKKVLIQQRANVLPDWLRFVKGVIDCPELPLSLSRENTKDVLLLKRLGMLVTRKIVKLLEDEQKADPEKYQKFFEEHGQFINEGIATDPQWRDKLAALYLADSSKLEPGKKTNLEGYISRMQPDQKEIYFLSNPNRNFAEASPYFEIFKEKGIEVLFIYQPIEEFVLGAINEFQGKKIISIETSNVDDKTDSSSNSELVNWLKETLKDRVTSVKATERLVSSPAFITDHESASLRKMLKFVEKEKSNEIPKQDLKINPSHPLLVKLDAARTTNPSLAEEIAHQLMDNAMMSAGLLDDSRHLIPRINKIMKAASEKALAKENPQ